MYRRQYSLGWSMALAIFVATLILGSRASAGTEKVLYAFAGGADGNGPSGNVIFDTAGKLYGTTYSGGIFNAGIVFELTPSKGAWKERVIHHFTGGRDGGNPAAGLVMDKSGHLFGTTSQGGGGGCSLGCGVVFELAPESGGKWKESVLHVFHPIKDGYQPTASLIFDKAGSLYGTTSHGGGYNSGSVFKLSPTRPGLWKLAVIDIFNGGWNGAAPEDGLIFDGRGNLYATTAFGGECNVSGGCGVVFELQHLSDGKWKEVVEHDFQDDGTDGYWPYGGLVFGASGALYGTTIIGGAACGYYVCGTVYEVAQDVKGIPHESVIHNFIGGSTDGRYPQDGLIVDSAGDLFGTAWIGPGDGPGMVFELTPTSGNAWTETILYSFTGGADGGNPIAGLTLDASGNLFGTTSIGGGGKCNGVEGPGCGVVFEVTP